MRRARATASEGHAALGVRAVLSPRAGPLYRGMPLQVAIDARVRFDDRRDEARSRPRSLSEPPERAAEAEARDAKLLGSLCAPHASKPRAAHRLGVMGLERGYRGTWGYL